MQPTIVLIHGAWHGAWCWEEHIAPDLRNRDYKVVSVTLPGHDNSGNPKRIWGRLSGYVSHVNSVVESIDGPVVLVGHSMGGLVTQRVLESSKPGGAVLVASVPRKGATGTVLRMCKTSLLSVLKTSALLSLWPIVSDPASVRTLFFTPDASQELVDTTVSRLQNESYPAFLSMLMRLPKPAKASSPVSVILAELDGVFTVEEGTDLAKAYGTTPTVVTGAGHDLMLDERWPQLADHIDTFTKGLSL